jgi:hypothetical protein
LHKRMRQIFALGAGNPFILEMNRPELRTCPDNKPGKSGLICRRREVSWE